ncbi:hypothetical protein [Zoogloea sp.]|uniref:hypothetical protein n=1 Tax=Zoogloea sp. TaxID=49181 RepID=UPI0035B08896
MSTSDEILGLAAREKYWKFAQAYLAASERQCKAISENEELFGYPDGAVCLYLAQHAIELFLKGMLISRKPDAVNNVHQISQLEREFKAIFTEPEFKWDVPFSELVDWASVPKDQRIPHDQLLRYPTKKGVTEWSSHWQGFGAQAFLGSLNRIREDFFRLQHAEKIRSNKMP